MSGFIGQHARKRRRNIFISFGIFSLIVVIFLIFPTFENNNSVIIPNDNIIPNPSELTSLASNIEELELNLFQKDQKIKFRDVQIKNLQTELREAKLQYDNVVTELNEIKNDLNSLSSNNQNLVPSDKLKSLQDNFTKLSLENDKNIITIKDLNKKIDELNINLQSGDNNINNIKQENQKLKKDNKSYFAKNLKLDNRITELEQLIIEKQIEVNSYLEQIKKLKDKSHHGG
jgi:chromosome segregation ATPase